MVSHKDMLDPRARRMLDEMEAAGRPSANELPVEQARENLEATFESLGPGPECAEARDLELPGPAGSLSARLLRGTGAGDSAPLIVYFHGGGHTIGSITAFDSVCRGLASATSAVLLNVEYRLAPEHPFPAAYEDAVSAVNWAVANARELGADARQVIVAGDSAGGNLAAAVCATGAGDGALVAQLLIYPFVSFERQAELFDERFENFFLSYAELEWFKGHYAQPETDLRDPRLSPLEVSSLVGAPPAIIVAAECDPIWPQGLALHERLLADGVASERLVYPGMIHGFFGMTSLFEQATSAYTDVGERLAAITAAAAAS
jgi:acetyl esterase